MKVSSSLDESEIKICEKFQTIVEKDVKESVLNILSLIFLFFFPTFEITVSFD